MSKNSIKLIIFDAGRVLVDFDVDIFAKAVAPYSSCSEEEIPDVIKRSAAMKEFNKGGLSPQEFHDKLVGILELRGLSFEDFKDKWQSIIFKDNESMESVLSRVRPDIKLAVLPDMDALSWERFANFPIAKKYFPDKNLSFPSFESGHVKSEKEAFENVLEKRGVLSGETVFVDDKEENLETFRNMGGNVIRYDCRTDSVKRLVEKLDSYGVFEK